MSDTLPATVTYVQSSFDFDLDTAMRDIEDLHAEHREIMDAMEAWEAVDRQLAEMAAHADAAWREQQLQLDF